MDAAARDDDAYQSGGRDERLPMVGEHGREPKTQGERIRWIRMQAGAAQGLPIGEPMSREDFCKLLARRSGEEERSITTIFRWERDEGRGPTLKEGVAMARLVGRSAEWLSALDDYRAEIEAQKQAAQAQLKKQQQQGRGAVPGHATQSRATDVTPRAQPMRKQGHGRGRKH